MNHNDESLIRDDDLRAQLEAQRGKSPVFDVYVRSLISTQIKRDEKKAADEAKANGVTALGLVAAWKGLDEGPVLDEICGRLEELKNAGKARPDASLDLS